MRISAAASLDYCLHRPELGAPYPVVAETYRPLEAASEHGFVAALPSFGGVDFPLGER